MSYFSNIKIYNKIWLPHLLRHWKQKWNRLSFIMILIQKSEWKSKVVVERLTEVFNTCIHCVHLNKILNFTTPPSNVIDLWAFLSRFVRKLTIRTFKMSKQSKQCGILYHISLNICGCFIYATVIWCASRIQNILYIKCQLHLQMSRLCLTQILILTK